MEGLKREAIDFIKATKTPGLALISLFKALCILYGFKEGKDIKLVKDEKNPMKKIPDFFDCTRRLIMNKPQVMIDNLKSYKEQKINEMDPSIISRWQEMMRTDENFTKDKLSNASEAAGSIYTWMTCIIKTFDAL